MVKEMGFEVILPLGGWVQRFKVLAGPLGGLVFPYRKEFEALPQFWEDLRRDRQKFSKAMTTLLKLLDRLHQEGIYIRDTKANNFLFLSENQVVLFDLDQVKIFSGPLSEKWREKNLRVLERTLKRKKIPTEWLKPD